MVVYGGPIFSVRLYNKAYLFGLYKVKLFNLYLKVGWFLEGYTIAYVF